MKRLLSKAVGKKEEATTTMTTTESKLTKELKSATKHHQRRKASRGALGCISAQPESSPSPEPKPKPEACLDATSEFVGLSFDPFR